MPLSDLDGLVGVLLGSDSSSPGSRDATTSGRSTIGRHVSSPDLIRYYDNVLAYFMNRAESDDMDYDDIIEYARNHAVEGYRRGDFTENELHGIMDFLDTRKTALGNELNKYGHLESARYAIRPNAGGALYGPPGDDFFDR